MRRGRSPEQGRGRPAVRRSPLHRFLLGWVDTLWCGGCLPAQITAVPPSCGRASPARNPRNVRLRRCREGARSRTIRAERRADAEAKDAARTGRDRRGCAQPREAPRRPDPRDRAPLRGDAEDAEDAYQRGLEILLTKAPTTREEELVPWLKTVVKHEAFALRRQRERHSPVTDDGHLSDRPTPPAITHDQAERLETLSQGAEALADLKPHEIRALVLKARATHTARSASSPGGRTRRSIGCSPRADRPSCAASPRSRAAASATGSRRCCRRSRTARQAREQLALLRPHMRTASPAAPRSRSSARCRRRSPRWCRPAGSVVTAASAASSRPRSRTSSRRPTRRSAPSSTRPRRSASARTPPWSSRRARRSPPWPPRPPPLQAAGRRSTTSPTTGSRRRSSSNSGSRWMPRPSRRRRRSRPHRRRSTRSGTGARGARSRRAGARGSATAGPARARPASSAAARSGQRVHADQPCGRRRRAGARRRGRTGGTRRPGRRRRRRR